MKYIYTFIFVVLFIIGCSDNATNTTEDDPPDPEPILPHTKWTQYTNNPVFKGKGWSFGTVSAPMVVNFKDTLRMWYGGSSVYGFDDKMHIGYAWSLDGINWKQYGEKPVLFAENEKHLVIPKVIVDGDTLRMWFGAGNVLVSSSGIVTTICYAVSVDGINWSRYPSPVMRPEKSWCKGGVLPGGVIKENGIFKMWFIGGISHYGYPSPEFKWSTGLATSPDGINWIVSDNPVLQYGSDFDLNAADCGTVLKTSSGYEMWYTGWRQAEASGKIGYATSSDGIHWEKYKRNPVLSAVSATGDFGNAFICPCVLFDGKNYKMWFAAWHGATPSIGYATSSN